MQREAAAPAEERGGGGTGRRERGQWHRQ
jgi:hypothetical protein